MAPDGVRALRDVAGEKHSAVDLVAAEVRRAILSGALSPGQTFAVTDLTAQLGVSHIPVREALRRLEAQGLVTLTPARRPMVAPLAVDDLDAVYDLRRRLEPAMVARAVRQQEAAPRTGWIPDLEGLMRIAFDPQIHPENQWDHHLLFHRALVDPAATPWERRILGQLWDAAERYTRLVFDPEDVTGPDELAVRERAHEELIEPVRQGDADGAAVALDGHLEHNHAVMRSLVAEALGASGTPNTSWS